MPGLPRARRQAVTRLVTATGLSARPGGAPALEAVDFHIDRGEIVTLVGPNGSGKTTLLRAIIGAVAPTAGSMRRAPGLRIGYVPQALHLDPDLPMTAARFLGLPHRVGAARAQAALDLAGVGASGDRPIAALSGGQRQRVLLARALLQDPDLLLLDEPTQGLDQRGEAAFYLRIEQLREELGCAVLMVSHELHVVMATSDRVVCLNHHVCCHGTPEMVASAPEYQALFGTGTHGALALYRHRHDHAHDPEPERKAS